MVDLYTEVNQFWKSEHRDNGKLEDTTFVSIAGGSKDTILDSDTTYIDGFADMSRSFHGFSTGIPQIWTSADHEGAVWCDQILQKVVLGAFEVSKIRNASIWERVDLLSPLFVGPKIPSPEPHFGDIKVPLRDVKVMLRDNYAELPALVTAAFEDRYIRITLPPLDRRKFYEMHLVSDIESLNVLACAKDTINTEFQCKSMNHFLKALPIPDKGDFEIVFRNPTDMTQRNRRYWTAVDVSLEDLDDIDTFIFHVPPENAGFLFADVRLPQYRIENDLTTKFLLGAGLTITPSSVKTRVKFLPIKDPIIKYRVKIQRLKGVSVVTGLDYQIPTKVPMLIMQTIGNESRPISMINNNLAYFYIDRNNDLNSGLELDIWTDPNTDPFELTLNVDIIASLSAFTTFFKTLWVSLGFCALLLAITSDRLDSPFAIFDTFLNMRLLYLTVASSVINFAFGSPGNVLNGNRDFIFVPLYTVQFYLSIGLMSAVFLIIYYCTARGSKFAKSRLLFVNKQSVKLGFAAIMILLSLKSNILQILCLTLQLLLFGFNVPSLIQSLHYLINGISNPIGNDYLGYITHILFSLYLSLVPNKEYNMKVPVWIIVVVVYIFGWKHTYLVNELGLAFMAVLMISGRVGLSKDSDPEFLKYD
ncbi:GPI inositol deacylase [Terramyces sp. JEL0728]|nr:GPI inositol deacylase [Terramyces sp. JEL0728]